MTPTAKKKTAKTKNRLPKKKRGPVGFVPTEKDRRRVRSLAGFGLTQDQIRTQIINPDTDAPISKPTLEKHFRHELDGASAEMEGALAKSLAQRALDPKCAQGMAAAAFILKCRFGWREKTEVIHEGLSGVLVVERQPATAEEWIDRFSKVEN